MAWIGQHVDDATKVEAHFRKEFYVYYSLFGLQRVGAASGLKRIGEHDWYQKLTRYILSQQQPNGAWPPHLISSINNTSFAVLFLAQARTPVLINKLRYGSEGNNEKLSDSTAPAKPQTDKRAVWNARPNDISNFVLRHGAKIERRLNWQLVDLGTATISDLDEAPLCYLSGQGDTRLAAQDIEKLRNYINRGGLLVIHVDRGDAAFQRSAVELCRQLYPAYEARALPPEHRIVERALVGGKAHASDSLMGISNGVRELVVIIAKGDPAAAWQASQWKPETAYQTMASIAQYACPAERLEFKGMRQRSSAAIGQPKRVIRVGRAKYKGNWNPEPAAWELFGEMIQRRDGIRLDLSVVDLDVSGQSIHGPAHAEGYAIIHLTGTDVLNLSAEAKQKLKQFAADGGLLLIDAAGGAPKFRDSVDAQLKEMFGVISQPAAKEFLSEKTLGGTWDISYRDHEALATLDPGLLRPRHVTANGKLLAVFSPLDVSYSLVGSNTASIAGFSPESGRELCRRLVLSIAATR